MTQAQGRIALLAIALAGFIGPRVYQLAARQDMTEAQLLDAFWPVYLAAGMLMLFVARQ